MSAAEQDRLLAHAEHSIAVGSKSFAAASRLFDPATRRSAVLLYAWCRHCDDVIDGQEAGHDAVVLSPEQAAARLATLEASTDAVYAGQPADTPAFAALADVVTRHRIPQGEPVALLEGFALDVAEQHYQTLDDVLVYCYHVAGVVGLMMARVMGVRDEAVLDRACDLGLAMQLTNIARDIVADAKVGRCYLPRQWLEAAGVPAAELALPQHRSAVASMAQRLVAAAEPYYASGNAGLAALPWRSAWAVATAGVVYRRIGLKVQQAGEHAWDGRLSTSRLEKLSAVLSGLWLALRRRQRSHAPRDPQAWQRPGYATAHCAEPAALDAVSR